MNKHSPMQVFCADKAKKEAYFCLMEESAKDYLEQALKVLGLPREAFREFFFTLGKVHGVSIQGEDIGFYWTEIRKDVLHLHAVIIREKHRGKGYGTRVLAHIEDTYKDRVRTIELGVHEENLAALRLYERSGFVKKAYRDDVGYHIMQKHIKKPPD